MNVKLEGFEKLEQKLLEMSSIRFEAIVQKQAAEMFNRGKSSSEPSQGGTPVDTGELRISLGSSDNEVGYTKDYAPHVNYGHRTLGGGYVPGQRFLANNAEIQRGIYHQDLTDAIKKG